MASRTVKLLHVEDDAMQQLLTAQQLATLPDYAFAITCADSEEQALAEFERSRPEVVVLDYHLTCGNGLSCLRQLRQLDPIVPVIALSGKATPEIAAELLRAGADNYLSKKNLAAETLTGCVKEALVRADAWRKHAPPPSAEATVDAARLVSRVLEDFAAGPGLKLREQLDQLESALRATNFSLEQFQQVFQTACAGLEQADRSRVLRPVLLEMIFRLWGDESEEEGACL